VEEFRPTFSYVKGDTNTGADALFQLTIAENDKNATEMMAEVYEVEEEVMCPIAYNVMREAQFKDFPEEQCNQWAMKTFGSSILYVTPTN
jgi:hypothetical protein